MIPNTDPATGIRYGCVSYNAINQNIADEMFNLISDKAYEDFFKANPDHPDDYDFVIDEPEATIEYDEKIVQGFWLGGAFNFLVIKSEVILFCSECSPCVPRAGNLEQPQDQEHGLGVLAYSFPKTWFDKE